jgi:hypothetical protein
LQIRDLCAIGLRDRQAVAVTANLKHQISRSSQSSTASSSTAVRMPSFFLSHRIPGKQSAALSWQAVLDRSKAFNRVLASRGNAYAYDRRQTGWERNRD